MTSILVFLHTLFFHEIMKEKEKYMLKLASLSLYIFIYLFTKYGFKILLVNLLSLQEEECSIIHTRCC